MASLTYRARYLGGLLKRVAHCKVDTFADRLILQKITYLMQASGIYLGYSFNWYIHGPYSPKLAADAFELESIKYRGIIEVTLPNSQLEEQFQEYLSFIKPLKNDPVTLELMASVHFLRKLHPGMSESQIVDRVVAKQPGFTATKVKRAWSELRKFSPLRV